MKSRKIVAVIPASGVGSRMGADRPKQYLYLRGKTILEHTLSAFLAYTAIDEIVIAVSESDPYYANIPLLKHEKIRLVFGGATRAESVFNALKTVSDEAWVLVHDAARPLLKRSDLDKLLQITDPNGAILAVPEIDTIKRAKAGKIIGTEDRSSLWHALTPQFFPNATLKQALQSAFEHGKTVTDEASAMELAGFSPLLVEGRSDNIKITRPEDLALAEFYMIYHEEHNQ